MDKDKLMGIKLFLDAADPEIWRRWLPLGMFYGVTTNPVLIAGDNSRSFVKAEDLVQEAFEFGIQELHIQAWGATPDEVYGVGSRLAELHPEIVVKVPVTPVGVAAAVRLLGSGVRVNMTTVFSSYHVVVASAIGADFVAPYFGRIQDAGRDALAEVSQMQKILSATKTRTKLLVASIRSVREISYLGAAGVQLFTFGGAVAESMFSDWDALHVARTMEDCAEALGDNWL